MPRKKVAIQVAPSHLMRLAEIAVDLRDAGLTIVDQIDAIGHLSGLAEEHSIAGLAAVPGVVSVRKTGDEGEPERDDYSIG